MKQIYKISLLGFLAILLTSCAVAGLTNDYNKLSNQNKLKIVKLANFKTLSVNSIYELSASELKTELKNHSKSIVYVFTNGCTSNLCMPLSHYQNFAKENKYKLFLVMTGYADLNETLVQNVNEPLFSINSAYYNTKYRFKYTQFFENELQNLPIKYKEKEYKGSLFFFERDKLIDIKKKLPL